MSRVDVFDALPERARLDSPKGIILAGCLCVGLLVGGFGIWAGLGHVASAATAPGFVTAEGNRKAVQHRDGGPVAEVLVRDGEKVERGQVLIRLDLSDVAAEVQVLSNQRAQTLVRLARLRAESAGDGEIRFPPEIETDRTKAAYRDLIIQETALFDARRSAYAGNIDLLKQQIEGYHRQIAGYQGKAKAASEQLVLIEQELRSMQTLLKGGYVARTRVMAQQRAAAALRGDLDSLAADIARTDNEISKAELQIVQIEKERRESIAKDLNDAEAVIAQVEPRLLSARERLKRSELTAPEAGYVFELQVHSAGAAIVPGEVVLQIVPIEEALVIKAQVDPNDIDRVLTGQAVEIHLLPYRQRYMSIIGGTVLNISADRLSDPQGQRFWFEATIAVDPDDLKRSGAVIVPGMPVSALIMTGERTISEYFFDPIYHFYDYALKEE